MTTKTLTQDQVDAIVASKRRKDRERIRELEGQLAEHEQVKAQLMGACTDLEQRATNLTRERDAVLEQVASMQAQQRQERCTRSLADVYRRAGGARSDAAFRTTAKLVTLENEPEFDDAGELVAITVDGERFADVEAGMRRFLETNDHLAKAPASGPSPTGRPGGSPYRVQQRLEDVDPVALVNEGLRHG